MPQNMLQPMGAWGKKSPEDQCAKLTEKVERKAAKYDAKGRRFLGIRVGSGANKLKRLEAKRDRACAAVVDPLVGEFDPMLAEAGAEAAGYAEPVPTSTSLSSPLVVAAIAGTVILVGLGAVLLSGGSEDPAPRGAR